MMPRGGFSKTSRMPDVAKRLVYLNDLKEAVNRLDTAWNNAQVEDALKSLQYWHDKIKGDS